MAALGFEAACCAAAGDSITARSTGLMALRTTGATEFATAGTARKLANTFVTGQTKRRAATAATAR